MPFKLSVNYCGTNKRKNFLSERVVKVWNSLPLSIVNFGSLATFRNSINKINLRIYTKYYFNAYLFSECTNLILSFDCIVLYCMHVCRCTDFIYLPACKWLPPFAADV